MSVWTRYCPVCREELPLSGNRRLRVPGLGTRLVHAGPCADAIEAQGVLELRLPAKPAALDKIALFLVRYRAARAANPVKLPRQTLESHIRTLRLLNAARAKELVGEEDVELARQHSEEIFQAARRFVLHEREVCAPVRTELFA